jgi:hypothetical protein
MTDRDYFAAAALTGLVGEWGYHSPDDVAGEAYALADSMLRERERTTLDPEPAGKAQSCEVNLPQAASELGNPVRQLTQDSTGNTHEPVAWAVVYPNGEEAIIAIRKSDAFDMATASDRVVPLYRSPTLTAEEREAVEHFAWQFKGPRAATLRKLLERLK